jgi:hypothetical protein
MRVKNKTKKILSRRDFLKGAALGTLGFALGPNRVQAHPRERKSAIPFAAEEGTSKVVLIRNEKAVVGDQQINEQVVREMIDSAVMKFAEEADPLKAWSHYIKPDDTVGVKFTRCGWMRVHTEQPVIDAVVKRITDLKVPSDRIYAQDGGMPVEKCTALVNVPSVKIHTLAGIAASLKNYINFSENPSRYHQAGSVNLGEVWMRPEVKGKTRLIIVDMLRPYFGPGPQINPLHRWNYHGILVGTEPAAVDAVCLKICQAKRNLFKGEEWPITPPPESIASADKIFKLGISDPSKINLVRLGWEKDILI